MVRVLVYACAYVSWCVYLCICVGICMYVCISICDCVCMGKRTPSRTIIVLWCNVNSMHDAVERLIDMRLIFPFGSDHR